MNQRKYDSLPDDVKAVIDDMSGDNLVARFGPWWDKWDSWGRDKSVAKGNSIVILDDSARNKWRTAAAPVTNAWLAGLEEKGVKDAREIYNAMKKKIAELDG